MKLGQIFIAFITSILIVGMFLLFGLIGYSLVIAVLDMGSSEFVIIVKTPCIDLEGNPFEDEMCKLEIRCSKYGIIEEYKCSEDIILKLRDAKGRKAE